MQVLTDSLLEDLNPENQNIERIQKIPLYASNADLIYMSSFHRPRYTQGAFLEAFRCIYAQYTQKEPKIQYFGKPFSVQYRYAENMLCAQSEMLGVPSPTIFIGIGDNPKSDVRGARWAGDNWRSVLVRTGVFNGRENDEADPADFVFMDVEEAIDMCIEDKRAGFEIDNRTTAVLKRKID